MHRTLIVLMLIGCSVPTSEPTNRELVIEMALAHGWKCDETGCFMPELSETFTVERTDGIITKNRATIKKNAEIIEENWRIIEAQTKELERIIGIHFTDTNDEPCVVVGSSEDYIQVYCKEPADPEGRLANE